MKKDNNSDYAPSNENVDEESGPDEMYMSDADGYEEDYPMSSRTYTCNFTSCALLFNRLYDLKEHQKVHGDYKEHSINQLGSFTCPDCDTKFKRLPDLQRHVRSIHSSAKPFVCPHKCGKAFSRKDALKRHLISKKNARACAGLRNGNTSD